MRRGEQPGNLRRRLAEEAARLMLEQGIDSFSRARNKAAERLGVSDQHQLPDNREIEQAQLEYLHIFYPETQPKRLRHLRQTALRAMQLLARFEPRLVGPVLKGSAGEHSPVNLHLFAAQPEEISWFLMEQRIPHDTSERRYPGKPARSYPLFTFVAGDVQMELTVFPLDGIRQAPNSPVDGRPIKRADIKAVQRLLEESASE
ncbi:MAG TPA: hypothetical protein VGE50_08265 [Gammaproteobacteria bacterium]